MLLTFGNLTLLSIIIIVVSIIVINFLSTTIIIIMINVVNASRPWACLLGLGPGSQIGPPGFWKGSLAPSPQAVGLGIRV